MSPQRWQQVEDIFQTALDLAPNARTDYLAKACAGDAELRAAVEELIAQYHAAGDFIEAPAPVAGKQLVAALTDSDPLIGRRIGAYRIEREIGRGGMGAVYMAARSDDASEERVAVKLIKRGMDTDFIIRRFQHERQILASLDHPNIARLLDGGTTADGRPYFVMEFIAGEPLYHYCDARRLTIRERLALFRQICGAVHYAHQQLVIHRDIKPSNILIGADGAPKLLDFGIAKLLSPNTGGDTVTLTALRVMTPQYASPEQAQGVPVTFASDVYSLGVLLYELLTGHRPYHSRPHETTRALREEQPAPPSAAVLRADDILPISAAGNETVTLESPSRMRGATSASLNRELAGGLDNIILKALRKDARQRYQSAAELSEDLARWYAGQPVTAPNYFPATDFATAAMTAEMATGSKVIAVLPLKLLGALTHEDTGDNYLGVGLADALIARLSHVRRFTVRPTGSVLRYAERDDPFAAGRALKADFVLDGLIRRAGARIRVSVQLLDVRAGAITWAGQFDEDFTDVLSLEDALSARAAEALLPQLTGDERAQLAKRPTESAEAFEVYLRGRYHWNTFTEEGFAKALLCYQRAVVLDPHYAAAYTGIADYYNWLGVYGVMPFAETSAAAKEAATRAVALDDTLAEAWAALGFATVCRDMDWQQAEAQHRRAIELDPHYATGHVWYGFLLAMRGRFEEAVSAMRRAIELDPLSLINYHHLGWSLYHARRYAESLTAYRKLMAAEPQHGIAWFAFSWVLRQMGDGAEAVAAAERAVALMGRAPLALTALGASCAAAGQIEAAQEVLRELSALATERYVSPYHVALVYCQLGERGRALDLLEQAHRERDAWIVWMGVDPQLDALRADERFQRILRLIGLTVAGTSSGDTTALIEDRG